MSSRNIVDLCQELQLIVLQFINECQKDLLLSNSKIIITCTYRSGTEQNETYAQGRTIPGKIITNAKAGQSPHNCVIGNKPASKAFDFAIQGPNGKLDWDGEGALWKRAIAIGEALGLVSGSHFTRVDSCHMELKGWKDGASSQT